jgi:hypothetical protein
MLPVALALTLLAQVEVRSAQSGFWSAATTWENGRLPAPGNRVRIREGHRVVYDIQSEAPFRSVLIAGTLHFETDRDTRLDVGVINIQAGEEVAETGFDCDAHLPSPDPGKPRPALEVGTAEEPIPAGRTATIRLAPVDGMDPKSCPALVCCGGRMDFYGAPMSRTWIKLGAPVKAGDAEITLAEPVTGWRPGDRVILTSTLRQNKVKKTFKPSVRDATQTEERVVKSIEGTRLVLERAAEFDHLADRQYRGEVANLSRNVVVESAAPDVSRGHTMYHRDSAGSIQYAEFRHLGKEGVLGRYSMHFHRIGDTMRGSSVVGASIWDSGNRWITIHGTNHLVVRDCVGYRSVGHGFFMEDGTEVYNVLDRNLAVQAFQGKPLPQQVLPFDLNDGSGFWWANSLNSFTRNVAAECDEYGYFFQAARTPAFGLELPVAQPDGTRKVVDIRTLPFIRFEDNESHTQRRHAFNLGGAAKLGEKGVEGIGPDPSHPFVIRNMTVWDVHWAFHPMSPSVLVESMDVFNAEYAIWRPVYKDHVYRDVRLDTVTVSKEFMPTGTKSDDLPKPVDDLPPVTVITSVSKGIVRGTTVDNGIVKRVVVNGREAKATAPNFAEWEAVADPTGKVEAWAEDEAGNKETRPHVIPR